MTSHVIEGTLIDEQELNLLELCHHVGVWAEPVLEMIEFGVIEPESADNSTGWRFGAYTLKRTKTALRLKDDLQLNLSGLALALDLLDEVTDLRQRVTLLERLLRD